MFFCTSQVNYALRRTISTQSITKSFRSKVNYICSLFCFEETNQLLNYQVPSHYVMKQNDLTRAVKALTDLTTSIEAKKLQIMSHYMQSKHHDIMFEVPLTDMKQAWIDATKQLQKVEMNYMDLERS